MSILTAEEKKEINPAYGIGPDSLIERLIDDTAVRQDAKTRKEVAVEAYDKGLKDGQAEEKRSVERARKAVAEEIFKDLDGMELIKNHISHKKGEPELVSCARCTYEHYKGQALEEK